MGYVQNLIWFCERTLYPVENHAEIHRAFSLNGDIIETYNGFFQFKITGFLVYDDHVIAVFPKGYPPPEVPDKEAATLLRVLLKYRNIQELEQEEIHLLRGDRFNKSGRLVSALALLEDYKSNGYLRRTSVNRSYKTNGYIDWNRTIKTVQPVISNNRPVYLSPVIRSVIADPSNIICKIHRAVIYECIRVFGWLAGLPTEYSERNMMPVTSREAASLLEIELGNTYSQREIDILKLLIQYLSAKTGNNIKQEIEILATPYFHNTWEAICGYLFGNQYKTLKGIVPQPAWKNNIIDGKISQRPDILYIYNSILYILDAKYYDYTHNLPGWYDIVKQLFYKFTIEKNLENNFFINKNVSSKIKNVFILPENSRLDLRHLGDIYIDAVHELGDIHVYTVNSKKAMKIYAYGQKSDYRNILEKRLQFIYNNKRIH